ncbi:MAG: dihydrofolate reductase family protein [Chloroflexota bacterium]|nr:dihydrofolate reductase family protein [Chloroflexota bacterium]
MRKIIVGLFISLDGVIEGPGLGDVFEYAGWTMPYYTDEIGQYIGATIATCDALLLGRVTYQGFAAAFSSQTGGMADMLNNQPKYVVSTTLKTADWNNSTLINGNVVETIAALKQAPGRDISVSGSGTLVQTLMQHDLVDELVLMLYPVVLGTGKRLFNAGMAKTTLKLMDAKTTSAGVVLLRYQRPSD